jgi:hypothetical protein
MQSNNYKSSILLGALDPTNSLASPSNKLSIPLTPRARPKHLKPDLIKNLTKYINSSNSNKRPLTLTDKSTSNNNSPSKPHPPRPKNPENDEKPNKNPLTDRLPITKPLSSSNLDCKPISQKAILKNYSCYDLSRKTPYQEFPIRGPTPETPNDSSIDRNFGFSSTRKREILIKTNLNDSKSVEKCLPQPIFIRKKAGAQECRPDPSLSNRKNLNRKNLNGKMVNSPYGLIDLSQFSLVENSKILADLDLSGFDKRRSGEDGVGGGPKVLGKFSKVALLNRYVGNIDLRTAESVLGGNFRGKYGKGEVLIGEVTGRSQSPEMRVPRMED